MRPQTSRFTGTVNWVEMAIDEAAADALTGAGWDADWQPAAWLFDDSHVHWVAAALALASAVLIWNAHSGQERRKIDRRPC